MIKSEGKIVERRKINKDILRELTVNRGDLEKNGDGVKFKNNKVKKQRAKKMKGEFVKI